LRCHLENLSRSRRPISDAAVASSPDMLPPSYFSLMAVSTPYCGSTQSQNTLYDKLELSGSGVF
jgi:hypothetical protein